MIITFLSALRVNIITNFDVSPILISLFFAVGLQEEDTEKIFYGVDDIKAASDIIIVKNVLSTCYGQLFEKYFT